MYDTGLILRKYNNSVECYREFIPSYRTLVDILKGKYNNLYGRNKNQFEKFTVINEVKITNMLNFEELITKLEALKYITFKDFTDKPVDISNLNSYLKQFQSSIESLLNFIENIGNLDIEIPTRTYGIGSDGFYDYLKEPLPLNETYLNERPKKKILKIKTIINPGEEIIEDKEIQTLLWFSAALDKAKKEGEFDFTVSNNTIDEVLTYYENRAFGFYIGNPVGRGKKFETSLKIMIDILEDELYARQYIQYMYLKTKLDNKLKTIIPTFEKNLKDIYNI